MVGFEFDRLVADYFADVAVDFVVGLLMVVDDSVAG